VIVLLLYTATIMPFRMAFIETEYMSDWFVFELVIDFLFACDVYVNCNSAYYDDEGKFVKSRGKIF
jgi:hypothetical protein